MIGRMEDSAALVRPGAAMVDEGSFLPILRAERESALLGAGEFVPEREEGLLFAEGSEELFILARSFSSLSLSRCCSSTWDFNFALSFSKVLVFVISSS